MIRALVAVILGAVVTFALFAFMSFLVSLGGERLDKGEKTPPLVINPDREDSKTTQKTRFKPKPPPPPDAPPPPAPAEPDTNDSSAGMQFDIGGVDVGGVTSTMDGPGVGGMQDGEATPIVRIDPRYPIKAARDGKEGYVVLSFTINEIGGVDDVKVIEAKPKRLFDKEARRALKRWKYKPKLVDGKPQKVPNQTVRLDFTLDKAGR
jgi:protein TonB